MSENVSQKKNTTRAWSPTYEHGAIEPKWQQAWENQGIYTAQEKFGTPKYYCLDFFPYPSGEGLHVGHCRNYIPTDVLSRYQRMRGYNVLHPMGWDSFGEPAEQFAIEHGVHPRVTTDRNTANYRRQMKMIGTSYDWSREIDSSDPSFYRWTQWFFLLLYRRGLAYRDMNWQWWCPVCKTTLSSHEAIGGVCWRGHRGVIKREIPAWYFRITAYADKLLEGLDGIDWPEPIKTMQRNWIGRSEGCEITFRTETGEPVPVFTTRPDTIFGVTFFVLSPEHSLVTAITSNEQREAVENYIEETSRRSEVERMSVGREPTGVSTGGYVIHPMNGEKIPVWTADYVLPSYGTGAVMGVPAHDPRDFSFARKYDLPIRWVIRPYEYVREDIDEVYVDPGQMINSEMFDGLPSDQGGKAIGDYLESRGEGKWTVQYRMRDWLISRQRYWGTPIPIIYCDECGEVAVPEEQLPVLLPSMEDFMPDGSGRSPLARLPEFVLTTCPSCQGPAHRETDTMGGFACSSWYFLRFTSPHYEQGPFDTAEMKYWMPVDLYVGGAEHAVLHLLYARFWTKVLFDSALVPFDEPFTKLMNQGQLMAADGLRMSKSRGNVITPDYIVETYSADALRVYELFMAPFDQDVNWSVDGINGATRFLNRIWNLYRQTYVGSASEPGKDPELERHLQRTIKGITERIEDLRLNTMISSLMEFVNSLIELHRDGRWHSATFHRALDCLMVLIAPAMPHIAEELWHSTGHSDSVHQQVWPSWNPDLVTEEMVMIPVQIDGKVREVIEVSSESDKETVHKEALMQPKIEGYLTHRDILKVIYIPGKILSYVTKPGS